jgi:hypothetical protein
MHPMAKLSASALRSLLDRVLKTNQSMGQCLECETASEDMHSTQCKTAAAVLEARFALAAASLEIAQ